MKSNFGKIVVSLHLSRYLFISFFQIWVIDLGIKGHQLVTQWVSELTDALPYRSEPGQSSPVSNLASFWPELYQYCGKKDGINFFNSIGIK